MRLNDRAQESANQESADQQSPMTSRLVSDGSNPDKRGGDAALATLRNRDYYGVLRGLAGRPAVGGEPRGVVLRRNLIGAQRYDAPLGAAAHSPGHMQRRRLRRSAGNDERLERLQFPVTVVDRGIGMDPEEVELATTRFGQVTGPWIRDHAGTGLGLPLAIGLAELHGATLTIKSIKGLGTTVTVAFPIDRSEGMPGAAAELRSAG